jgi:hypothetical protein
MLGDALAAEELRAFRATRHRLAPSVIETALMDKQRHGG